jgi:hypothetical protein
VGGIAGPAQDPAHNAAAVTGVGVGPASEVAAVGALGTNGEQDNGWIRVFHVDGAPWWGDAFSGAAHLEDAYNAVAFDAAGSAYVVGSETVIGQQTNAIVVKYVPL